MKKLLKRCYFLLILFFLYAPIFILMLYSFNDSKSRGKWGGFTLKWYEQLANDSTIMRALLNTLSVAFLSAVIATVIGTVAAIGIYYMGKFSQNMVMNIAYLPVMNPDIVTGVSLMLFFLFFKIPMGFGTVLIAHITFNIPYVILMVQPKLAHLNRNLVEAAEDLGASSSYALWRVVMPEIMPGVVSGFLLALTLSIDDFVISFFTKGAGFSTLSVQIYAMARRGVNPSINALSTIMFVVVVLLLFVINIKSEKEN